MSSLATPQGESPFAPAQTPRLSVVHLMLWTLCSAGYLAVNRSVFQMQGDEVDGIVTLQRTTSVIQSVVVGATLAGGLILVSARLRNGPPLVRDPGHWLLLVSSAVALTYLPLFLLGAYLSRTMQIGLIIWLVYGFFYAISALAYGVAVRLCETLRWKLLFGALATVGLFQSVVFAGVSVDPVRNAWWMSVAIKVPEYGRYLISGAMIVVAAREIFIGQRRDWLHWTGIATYLMGVGVTVVWMIGALLIQGN